MEISFGKLMSVILQKIWWIILVAVTCAVLLFSYTILFVKPSYRSNVQMVVVKSEDRQETISDAVVAQRQVNSYIAILDTIDFYDSVAVDSNLGYTGSQIKGMFSFSVIGETEVFDMSVTCASPNESKIIADSATKIALKKYKDALNLVSLKSTSPARRGVQVGPNIIRNTIFGGLIGAIIVVLVVFLKEILDARIKTEDDLLGRYDLPLLGTIPDFSTEKTKKLRHK